MSSRNSRSSRDNRYSRTSRNIQAMAIANKGREGEVELTNLSASSGISLTFNHT